MPQNNLAPKYIRLENLLDESKAASPADVQTLLAAGSPGE